MNLYCYYQNIIQKKHSLKYKYRLTNKYILLAQHIKEKLSKKRIFGIISNIL